MAQDCVQKSSYSSDGRAITFISATNARNAVSCIQAPANAHGFAGPHVAGLRTNGDVAWSLDGKKHREVGAARADAGDPRDVVLCNLLTYVHLRRPFT